MSIYTHNKGTRIVTMNLPEEIHGRDKVRSDFGLLYNDEISKTRFRINEEESMSVSLLKLDFHRMQFISRAAADEILCQLERLSCRVELNNIREHIHQMLHVVLKKHPNLNLLTF